MDTNRNIQEQVEDDAPQNVINIIADNDSYISSPPSTLNDTDSDTDTDLEERRRHAIRFSDRLSGVLYNEF